MSYMFYYCKRLTSLDVSGFDTSNVIDMHVMFYGCSGLTNVDVSGFDTSKVTNMSSMFHCSSLTSLDVSGFDTSKVTDMSSMFDGCSSLTSLDVSGFDTSKVKRMISMFSKCSRLTSLDLSGFDTSNVYDSDNMFSGCEALKKLNTPLNVKENAQLPHIMYDSEGNAYDYLPENLDYSITLYKDKDVQEDPDVQPDSALILTKAIYKYGRKGHEMKINVLNKVHSIETSHNDFKLVCSCQDPDKAQQYILLSGNKVISESSDGEFKDIDASKFISGSKVYVIVKGISSSTKNQILLEVKDKKSFAPESVTLLGSGFDLTLSDEIPLVGGKTVSLDMPSFPVEAIVEDGKLKIGINIKEENLYSSNSYEGLTTTTYKRESISKQMESWRKDTYKSKLILQDMKGYLKDGNLKADIPFMEKNATVSVMGYFEGAWSDRIDSISGSIILIISGDATFQGQTVIVVVPVTANIKVEGSASAGGRVQFNLTSNPVFEGDITSEISIGLEPYVGIGAGQWVSAGIYGNLTSGVGVVWISSKEKSGPKEFYLTGEVGGKAYFATKEYKAALFTMKDLKNNKNLGPYIDSDDRLLIWSRDGSSLLKKGLQASSYKAVQMNLYKNPDAYFITSKKAASAKLKAAGNNESLIDNAYPAAMPQIATCGGSTIMAYVDIDESRATANQTIVKYAVYDERKDSFSNATAVLDDGTADAMPQLYKDGDDLYLCWQDSRIVYNDNDDPKLSDYTKTFGISIAKFDKEKLTFRSVGRVDQGNSYCYMPSLSAGSKGLRCVWVENQEGNLFGTTGTNSICSSTYLNGKWSDPEVIVDNLSCITGISCGNTGTESMIAYVLDKDNDLTTEEKSLYIVTESERQMKLADEGRISSPVFASIKDVNGLFYNKNGGILSIDGFDQKPSQIITEGTIDADSDFVINNDRLFYLNTKGNKRNIIRAEKQGDVWNHITLTDESAYVDSFGVSGDHLIYLLSKLSIDGENDDTDEISTVSSIKYINDYTKSDLVLEGATFDHENLSDSGSDLLMLISLRNNGTSTVDGIKLKLVKKGSAEPISTTSVSANLAPGENMDEVVSFSLPSNIDPDIYTVVAYQEGISDSYGSDNEIDLDFSKPDIVTEADYVVTENDKYIEVTVSNTGLRSAEASTSITNEEGTVLSKYTDVIAAGGKKTYQYNLNNAGISLDGSGSVITVSSDTSEEEYYEINNISTVRAWDLDVEDSTKISNAEAEAVIDRISKLPDINSITTADAEAIREIRSMYDELSDDQKLLIDEGTINILIEAEKAAGIDDTDPETICNHEWSQEYAVDIAATCTEDGSESIHCLLCGAVKENTSRPIKALGHTYSDWETKRPATCTETGVKEKKCYNCGEVITDTIPATGHQWNKEFSIDKIATCTEEGEESIHCSKCDATKGNRPIAKTSHQFSAWTTIKKATETAAGQQSHKCSVCGKTEITTIPQLAPTLKVVKIKKPKAAKKSMTVKWKKVSKKNLKKIKKIEIQYSTDKKFKAKVKTKYVKAKKKSLKIKKLKSKKKYYVRIRAYTKSGSTVHVSKWSAVKSVKTQ